MILFKVSRIHFTDIYKLLFMLALGFAPFSMAATEMPAATNLFVDGKQAEAKNIPIAILLVHDGVSSGEVLKEEAIYPNLLSGVFDGKVIFREIAVNRPGNIIDFYGEPLPKKAYQNLFNITSLPAMVFVDADGNALATPLFSGAYEYYGYYLKQQLNQAMQTLHNPTRFE